MTARLKIEELESPAWLRQKYWNEKLTAAAMSELLGCSKAVVLRRMRKHNVPTRSLSQIQTLKQGYVQYKNREWLWKQYIEKELSTHQIADQIGCTFQTICRWLKEFDIPKRDWVAQLRYENRESSWNDKFFDELSPSGAYIIGLIIADGSLRGINAERYNIQISQKNRKILEQISDVLDGGSIDKATNAWILNLNSKHAYEILTNKFGIPDGGAKSYNVRIPEHILERNNLLPHCIRGVFDGDGSVAKGGTHFGFCSGSLDLLNDIGSVLTDFVFLPQMEPEWCIGGFIKKNGERSGAYNLYYHNVLDVIDFARFIYGPSLDAYGSILYLERKRKRFQTICDRWRGRIWLCEQIDRGKTNQDIADELGVAKHRVSKVLNGIGIYDFPYKDSRWLRNAVEIQGRSIISMGKEFSVRNDQIQYYCDKYDIEYVPLGKAMPKEVNDPEWLRKKYWEEGLSMREMAGLIGVALNTIKNRMKKYNIPRRCTRFA